MQLLINVKKLKKGQGFFEFGNRAIIATVRNSDLLCINQLIKVLNAINVNGVSALNACEKADIRICRLQSYSLQEAEREKYFLNITTDGIEISSKTDAGIYYGIQTLIDMVKLNGSKLPCCEIQDWPDYERRGVYLDVSRGKVPTIATLKWLIEKFGSWKINELQLYIENVFQFARHPQIGQGYDPYSVEDILEIQDFCKLHHIRLVGSLASLGHLEKILMLPQYQHLAELKGFRGYAGGTTICPTDPKSITFITELYEEYLPLFEADDFNFCGDEPWELGMGRSAENAKQTSNATVYAEYFTKMHELCRKLGKRPNAWADILLQHSELIKKIPCNTVLLNWEYEANGKRIGETTKLFESMHDFMVCPGTSSWNTHGTRLDNAIANVSQFAEKGLECKAEGLLNTDWGDNGHRNFIGVSLHGFAHSASHGWNHKAVDDKNFTNKFAVWMVGAENADGFAEAIRVLGNTYKNCGAPYNNHCALFFTLIEPFDYQPVSDMFKFDMFFGISRIDAVSIDGCSKVIESLKKIHWYSPKTDMDSFDRLIFEEYALAARMDSVAAKRALIGKQVRAGERFDSKSANGLAEEMDCIITDFKRLWMARNRKSQIDDNLNLFENAKKDLIIK